MVSQGSRSAYRTIIVGAGSSSAKFIPEFCRIQSVENVRVTFIDHDWDQIEGLRRELDGLIDDGLIDSGALNTVLLEKPRSANANIRRTSEELGLSPDKIDWASDKANDNPPVIRVLTHIQWENIRSAIDAHIQRRPEGTPMRENRIVYVFGVTGMTSSTVAVEVSGMYRRYLDELAEDTAYLEAKEINHLGLALMSPTPEEGASVTASNIGQGYKVCSMLSDTLPAPDATVDERRSFPFDNLFLIDGSGFGGSTETNNQSNDEQRRNSAPFQKENDFSEWSANTLASLLYPRGEEEGSIDTVEILDNIRTYRNLALGRTGWTRDEIISVQDQMALDDFMKKKIQTPEPVSEVRKRLQSGEEDVTQQLETLRQALEDEKDAKEELDKHKSSIIRFINKGIDKESKYEDCVKNTDKAYEILKDMVRKRAENLDRQFTTRRFRLLWSTPSLQETIGLVNGQQPGNVLTNLVRLNPLARQLFRSERNVTLMHMLDPTENRQTKAKSINSWEIGPPAVRRALYFPLDEFNSAIMEDGKGASSTPYPLTGDMIYSMIVWEPADGRMMPRYYRDRPKSGDNLPGHKDAWPCARTSIAKVH